MVYLFKRLYPALDWIVKCPLTLMKDIEETDASEGIFPSVYEVPQHFIELRTAQRSVLLIWPVC